MSMYVTDTHPLIYCHSHAQRHLSDRARAVFEQAENGEAMILIPATALWEISMLEQAGHVKLNKPFGEWLRGLLRKPCFDCSPLDADVIAEARAYSFNNDIFDAAIVAIARLRDLPLITRDVAITNSGLVEIYW
ncbi:MAG TPA: PIN domain-containing protein [Blastocatellia bacterium]|nr:PIN domain-containing protein [Blastocatellia bacterium]